jgi:D-alanyl-D-alanine carboxypeptidase (penicillin-binding protein 5/6)
MRLLLLFCLLPLLTAFGPPSLIESGEARAPLTESVVDQVARARRPSIGARAAILIDAADGQPLWQREADRRLAMASTTKIMTALVAIDGGSLDTPIRVTVGAAQLPGNSVAGLRQGDQLPLGEALYALLLPSGNDAALSIAASLAGSTEGFVARMNRRAEELGLANTHFANPHGWDAPEHYASARDLARLARAALERPVFAEVVATKEHTYRGQLVYQWTNTNRLLWLRADAVGVKTGTTDEAGASLVASARRGERRAIAVVLDSPDRWAESGALLDHFFVDHVALVLAPPPSPFYRGLPTPAGRTITVPLWQAPLLSVRARPAEDGGLRFDFAVAGAPVSPAPSGPGSG